MVLLFYILSRAHQKVKIIIIIIEDDGCFFLARKVRTWIMKKIYIKLIRYRIFVIRVTRCIFLNSIDFFFIFIIFIN